MSKKAIIFCLLVISCGLFLLLFKNRLFNSKLNSKPANTQIVFKDSRPQIKVGNANIFIDLADNNEEKAKGLSGRKTLKDNEGMLFVFESKSSPAFWMKDMLISIDIIWIADGKIIKLDESVPPPPPETPSNELPLYRPPVAIDYVLEVKAGFSEKNGVEVGDNVDISKL
ncbi:MAG: hypothetical protein UT24_C0001G0062 [Candidatus Woesebacteria bacterium GW2011_GWB1_39_12]|uniref:DUF192 domain-containing protein n=2 Tax=Candidatus Woeseibacteriota TaxID=1752722 RepID=A0A0G0QAR7_9BACT|nr:MAG: hypothetical protein UT23_C0001G0062 [Candidatus Woesebacteria bacterium GW2011_GWA1_39_12]KKR01902.1 MAG: hypothetical protein UT24_C0001G0062 [Candidatus Woesebacteria bacterium GW2011_GWB1_39_12]